jgi:hypothetical protein
MEVVVVVMTTTLAPYLKILFLNSCNQIRNEPQKLAVYVSGNASALD